MENTTLGKIADIQTGPFGSQLHNEDYADVGTPIVTVEHLGRKRFTTQNLPKVKAEDKERLAKYVMTEGDVIFSRVGSVDRCSFARVEEDGWMFSGRCLRVRSNSDINAEWLYYYLTQPKIKEFIKSIAVGATMPSINTKLMSEIPVEYPTKEEQGKIACLLSAIDAKIERNEQINNNLAA